MIVLHQFTRKYGIPNVSPFCMKVENYLRLAKLDYKSEVVVDPAKTPKGKAPYIVDGTTVVADSRFILDYLDKTYDIDLDAGLDDRQRAIANMIVGTLEERMYFAVVYDRWIGEKNWPTVKKLWFDDMPPIVRSIIPIVAQKKVRATLRAQGIGRHDAQDIYRIGVHDIDALAVLLGSNDFVFGDKPTRVDATVHAFAANVLQVPLDSPIRDAALRHDNLIAYCERLGKMLYPDMENTHVVTP